MYAIIKTGGRQYKVAPGDVIEVNRLPVEVGQTIDLSDVLLIGNGPQTMVGRPTVPGAVVRAEVADNFRSPKIIVFKYKSKVRYRKFNTHRQDLTRLAIKDIYPTPEAAAQAEAAAQSNAPAEPEAVHVPVEGETEVTPVAVETAATPAEGETLVGPIEIESEAAPAEVEIPVTPVEPEE